MSAAAIGPLDAVLLTHDRHDDSLDAAGRAQRPRALDDYLGTITELPRCAKGSSINIWDKLSTPSSWFAHPLH